MSALLRPIPDDKAAALTSGSMTRPQVVAVLAAVLLSALEGYDVQAMSFAAPAVSVAWGIGHATLGIVLASGLFGMASGSIVLTPLADTVGRRPVMLVALVVMTLGSLASAVSGTVWELALSRAITGIGIGAMIVVTTTLAAELASARRRALAVASTTTCFGLGSVVGGISAAAILRAHNWHWIFAVAALAGALLLVFVALALPESPVFLASSTRPGSLAKLNTVLRRLGRPPAVTLATPGLSPPRISYYALFAGATAGITIRFTVFYVLAVTATYYLFSWLPQLIADAGFSAATASLVTVTSSVVAIPAGLIFGAFAARFDSLLLTSGGMIGFGLALAALGLVSPTLVALIVAVSVCGFFLQATTAVFYATMAASFPPLARATGIGFVMGFGRLFSGVGPLIAGGLFKLGWTRLGVSMVFAGAAIAGGVILLASRRRLKLS